MRESVDVCVLKGMQICRSEKQFPDVGSAMESDESFAERCLLGQWAEGSHVVLNCVVWVRGAAQLTVGLFRVGVEVCASYT